MKLCDFLIKIQSVKIQPSDPFTLSSGKKSPIYCDARRILAHPKIRSFISSHLSGVINEKFGKVDTICGIATGGIPHAMMVATDMYLPMIYVRSSAKEHGMKNLVEGEFVPGQAVVLVEDIVTTGGSTIKAVNALKEAGLYVKGAVSIFNYGFESTNQEFIKNGISLFSLANSTSLLNQALHLGIVSERDMFLVSKWVESNGETIFQA